MVPDERSLDGDGGARRERRLPGHPHRDEPPFAPGHGLRHRPGLPLQRGRRRDAVRQSVRAGMVVPDPVRFARHARDHAPLRRDQLPGRHLLERPEDRVVDRRGRDLPALRFRRHPVPGRREEHPRPRGDGAAAGRARARLRRLEPGASRQADGHHPGRVSGQARRARDPGLVRRDASPGLERGAHGRGPSSTTGPALRSPGRSPGRSSRSPSARA